MKPRWRFGPRSGVSPYTLGMPLAVALCVAVLAPEFLQAQNWRNLTGQMAGLFIIALGQMLVALAAGIDLSVASVISLTSAIVAVTPHAGLGIALALGCGVVVGLVNGMGIAVAGVHPLVMTLATMTFLQGLTYTVLQIPGGTVPPALVDAATGNVLGLPIALLWCVLLAALVSVVLRHTRWGLHLFATGAQGHSAALNGVPTTRTVVLAYVACSLLAVVAGLFLTARIGSGDPTLGAFYGLESVTAIALGGVLLTGGAGSVLGVFTGTATLGLISNGINLFGVSPFLRSAIVGALLIVAVAAQRRKGMGL